MACYVQLEDSTRALKTPVQTLGEFEQQGLIAVVEEDGLRHLQGLQRFSNEVYPGGSSVQAVDREDHESSESGLPTES